MKCCYIAGKFRAANQWEQELNIREAEALGLEVWRLGAAAIVPHLNTCHFQGVLPDEVWLQGDLEILRRCDFILMTQTWQDSVGATEEHQFALAHGIPVFYSLEELRTWLTQQT